MITSEVISTEEFKKLDKWSESVRGGHHHDSLEQLTAGKAIVFEDHGPYNCAWSNAASCALSRQAYRVGKRLGYRVSIRHYDDGRIGVAFFDSKKTPVGKAKHNDPSKPNEYDVGDFDLDDLVRS